MATKKKAAEPKLSASEDGALAFERIRSNERRIKSFFRCTAATIVAYVFVNSIDKWAGRTTSMDVALRVLGDIRFSSVVSWAAGGSGLIYGLRQRALRRKTVERLEGRIRNYETKLDPGRTSSLLTSNGETNPEDL